MKISLNWLREWLDLPADAAKVAEKLTLAGIECEAQPLPPGPLDNIVLGRICNVRLHPMADRLKLCDVDIGRMENLAIVCGAPQVRAGSLAVVALPGAKLPGGTEIKESEIRGMKSAGMLCSAQELGLAEKSEGLLYLDADASPGKTLSEYLGLADHQLVLELTPNRGDALSAAGLARELAALYGTALRPPAVEEARPTSDERVAVEVLDAVACASYAGRVIHGLDPHARTPDWMREKLRRSGVRGIHPVVDITQYVMLELGQPLHGFDCAKLSGTVRVRRAQAGEKLNLLNEQTIALAADDLLIADERGPLALAGVMGGAATGVTATSTSVFLESAWFAPAVVAGTGRRHRIQSDALYRFERGVDPGIQRKALERATQLVLKICGGWAGPVTHVGRWQPELNTLILRRARIRGLLGYDIPADEAERLLRALGVQLKAKGDDAWEALIPSYRHDLAIEADLVEEVARLHGYERIPARPYAVQLRPAALPEAQRPLAQVRALLAARGYHEAVTYSFVDPKVEAALTPEVAAIPLDNPMSENLSVLRTTLWSGLIPAWLYNHQRQQRRVRLFEFGTCFTEVHGKIIETQRVSGLVAGEALPEQWGASTRAVDFYDLKGDVEALLAGGAMLRFEPAEQHPSLHPRRAARIRNGRELVGWLGELSPRVVRELDLPAAPQVFELFWPVLRQAVLPRAGAVPDRPSSRRDLALVLSEEVPAQALVDCARRSGGGRLVRAFVFDVYRGDALPKGCKSIALGLIFQDYSRTLTDTEVDAAVQAVADNLKAELGAAIRA